MDDAQIAATTCNGKPLAEVELGDAVLVDRHVNHLLIVVPGPTPGKPRMTQRDKWKKRPCVVRYREWCDRVRAAVGDAVPAAEDVACLSCTAYFEPPKSWPKRRRVAAMGTPHQSKPDIDNLCKTVLDCLWPQGDAAIASIVARKRWDWKARLEVGIEV